MTTKRKKPLVCSICGKKFYYSAKTHPLTRLNKHRWKEHPKQARKSISNRTSKSKIDAEQDLADDLLLKQIEALKTQYSPRQPYQAEHNIAVGTLIEGVMLGIELVKQAQSGVKKVKEYKKKVKK